MVPHHYIFSQEVTMKKIMCRLTVFVVLLNCNCFIFSSYQSAKMLRKGEKVITPNAGFGLNNDLHGVKRYQIPLGITWGFAPSERVNVYMTEGFYSSFITIEEEEEEEEEYTTFTFGEDEEEEEEGPDFHFLNYGGVEVKIGLQKNSSALSSTVIYHLGPGDYELALQVGTKYIKTYYFSSGADLTLSPHIGYILSGYSGPYLGSHLSVGVPLGEKVTVRPEIGVASIEFSEWMFNAGVGFIVSL